MRVQKICLLLAGALIGSTQAQAQTESSPMLPTPRNAAKINRMVEEEKAKAQGDLDKEITDIKMRAHSGSKSKYSSSFSLTYMGAALSQPGGDSRPSLGGNRIVEPTSLSGSVGLRYRMDKNDSVSFSTGINRPQPLQKSEIDQPLQVSTPRLSFNKTFAMGEKQISSEATLYVTTLRSHRAVGEIGSLAYSLTALNPIASSRFEGGVSMNVWETAFDSSSEYDAVKYRQNDTSINIMPTLQYKINDHFNAFTSLAIFGFSHYRDKSDFLAFQHVDPTQIIGVGYAIARDFYFAPSITLEPEHLALENASYMLSTRFNL